MKSPKCRNKKKVLLYSGVIGLLLAIAVVAIVMLWEKEPPKSNNEVSGDETTSEVDSSVANNQFLLDLSCSGTITNIDDRLCFVTDQIYSVEIDGEIYENVNLFFLSDPNYQKWAEKAVIARAASIEKSDAGFVIGLQYVVAEDICLCTPFSEYHFPAEWSDRLIVSHHYSDAYYSVDFYADMGEQKEYLFSIIMGNSDGEPIGKLTNDMDEVTMVYLRSRVGDFNGYDQTRQDYLYGMMDGINYLLDKLYENPDFTNEF